MITVKLEGIEDAIKKFDPKIVRSAARAAIDRATKSGKTVVSEEVRKSWNVKKSDLDDRIRLTPPRIDDLKGVITIGGRGMSLSYFGARQITAAAVISRTKGGLKSKALFVGPQKRARDRQTGVIVQVMKGKDTVLLRNAFMAKTRAGKTGQHIGVFHRLTKKRLPIEEKNVISIASMANKPEIMRRITDRITERWQVEFPRQLQYFLSKGAAK